MAPSTLFQSQLSPPVQYLQSVASPKRHRRQ
ncbi:hypothetical protein CCACVL1_03690 [Corchorus capsularis]|uniref:Uncharacterized protein n=1 Tax=Corchorus capsularis TaxID=210143 RepID=A0A1R3JXQ0_COCAP|nr:hypothetical protein CCACVL1_03690 [Corchorus capsularis]